jgi:hypothetical protein
VDNDAVKDSLESLENKVAALPWRVLNDSVEALRERYLDRTLALDGLELTFTRQALLRAAAKYGRALAHTLDMYDEIVRQRGAGEFDFEVSVDETETPSSAEEHFYMANELSRRGVRITSLAPRFEGRFEKGVDYIGDRDAFAASLAQHARIARHFRYKLSLHSGSDKLSIYPLFAAATGGMAHVKTAGTSYLEALRTLAVVDPGLFREILTLARERYPKDRATYHVSADAARVPEAQSLSDPALPGLLDQFDAREVLHVTFGSVLTEFGTRLNMTLRAHESAYDDALARHFDKHLAALAGA